MQSSNQFAIRRAAGVALLTAAALVASGALMAMDSAPLDSLPSATKPVLPLAVSDLLNGEQEVPAVISTASAHSTIVVGDDRSVSGGIDVSDIGGTAVHIHEGAAGSNGPVLVTLVQMSATRWEVPPKTTLTPAQYESYRAGNLYVNVHSAGHVNGEIRAQLRAH